MQMYTRISCNSLLRLNLWFLIIHTALTKHQTTLMNITIDVYDIRTILILPVFIQIQKKAYLFSLCHQFAGF